MRFFHSSPLGLAIFAIIAVFLAVWAFITARNPKRWRLWWMTFLNRADMSSTREQRRSQEFYLAIAGYVAFSLLLGVSVISAYCVVIDVQEQRQARSVYEQAKDKTMLDLEKMRTKKQFRKL